MIHAEDASFELKHNLVENNVIHWPLFFIDISESWEQMPPPFLPTTNHHKNVKRQAKNNFVTKCTSY